MFNLKAIDKFHGLCSFEIEVKNILITDNYTIQESEKFRIILNWIDI